MGAFHRMAEGCAVITFSHPYARRPCQIRSLMLEAILVAAALTAPTFAAAAFSVSSARWAYRAVVSIGLRPSSAKRVQAALGDYDLVVLQHRILINPARDSVPER